MESLWYTYSLDLVWMGYSEGDYQKGSVYDRYCCYSGPTSLHIQMPNACIGKTIEEGSEIAVNLCPFSHRGKRLFLIVLQRTNSTFWNGSSLSLRMSIQGSYMMTWQASFFFSIVLQLVAFAQAGFNIFLVRTICKTIAAIVITFQKSSTVALSSEYRSQWCNKVFMWLCERLSKWELTIEHQITCVEGIDQSWLLKFNI